MEDEVVEVVVEVVEVVVTGFTVTVAVDEDAVSPTLSLIVK